MATDSEPYLFPMTRVGDYRRNTGRTTRLIQNFLDSASASRGLIVTMYPQSILILCKEMGARLQMPFLAAAWRNGIDKQLYIMKADSNPQSYIGLALGYVGFDEYGFIENKIRGFMPLIRPDTEVYYTRSDDDPGDE